MPNEPNPKDLIIHDIKELTKLLNNKLELCKALGIPFNMYYSKVKNHLEFSLGELTVTKYSCPKCGSTELHKIQMTTNVKLSCSVCHAYVKFLARHEFDLYPDAPESKKQIKEKVIVEKAQDTPKVKYTPEDVPWD